MLIIYESVMPLSRSNLPYNTTGDTCNDIDGQHTTSRHYLY